MRPTEERMNGCRNNFLEGGCHWSEKGRLISIGRRMPEANEAHWTAQSDGHAHPDWVASGKWPGRLASSQEREIQTSLVCCRSQTKLKLMIRTITAKSC